MDIIPRFYIFGVPDGFDMLDGTSEYVSYFQKFYVSDCKENTKFSIHRDTKGNITYTYLKYNLTSGNCRTGSFFGMSLIFNNVYCADPVNLYKLFDLVYNSYVLIDEEKEKQGKEVGFIRPIKNNKDIQAQYDITRFQEKREYIQHYIKDVLLANIESEKGFKSDLCIVDSNFKNEFPNLVAQEPLESVSNDKLLADLRQYNRVAVSPDWKPILDEGKRTGSKKGGNVVVLASEYIASLLEYTKGYQKYIIDSLNDINSADAEEANDVYKEVATRLKEVKSTPSTDKRVSQIITDYTTLTEQLQSLIQKIEDGQTPPPPPPTPPTINPIPWWKNPKLLAVGGVAVLVAIILVIFVGKPSKSFTSKEQQIRIAQHVRELIAHQAYMEAINMADSLDVTLRKHLQDSALTLRIDSFLKSTYDYSDAYENIANKINNDSLRSRKQEELISAWEVYVDKKITDVEKSKNKENAKQWKEKINEKRSIGHQSDKFNTFNQRLEILINLSPRNPNPGITPPNTPSPTTKTKYRIDIWKCTREGGTKDCNWTANGKQTISEDKQITGKYFYYRLMKSTDNGSTWSSCGYNVAKDCIKVSDEALRTKGSGDGAYIVLNKTGTITVMDENKEKQFTITINN